MNTKEYPPNLKQMLYCLGFFSTSGKIIQDWAWEQEDADGLMPVISLLCH